MNTKTILIIIAVALVGIFGVLAYEANKKTPQEEIADSFSELTSEIADEVDDNTTSR